MKTEYLPTDKNGRLFRLIEEMGEVAHAIGKAGRHGMASYNPELPEHARISNAEMILRELDDLMDAITDVIPDLVTEVERIRAG